MNAQCSSDEPTADPGDTTHRRWPLWLKRQLVPNVGTLLLVALLVSSVNVWAKPLLGPTNDPGPSAATVNYQGRLADATGTPLDGTYAMSFALWDSPAGGNLAWGPETHAMVPVSNGLFNVGLGSQTTGGIPTSVWTGDRFLEITVDGETLSPREPVRSVPIAGLALSVPDAAVSSRNLAPTVLSTYSSGEVSIGDLNSPTEVLSLAVTFPLDGTYLVFVQVAARHDQGGRITSYLEDENGAPVLGSSVHTQHPTGGTQSGSTSVVHVLGAGAHTLRLFAGVADPGGSGAIISAHIIAIPFGQ